MNKIKVLLMGLLAGGLVLTSCSGSNESNSGNGNQSQNQSAQSSKEVFDGQVAGHTFKSIDYYVKVIEGEMPQEQKEYIEEQKQVYATTSKIVFNKDTSFAWTLSDQKIEGSFSQTNNDLKMICIRVYRGEELLQDSDQEQAESMALHFKVDGETIEGCIGTGGVSGGGSKDSSGSIVSYSYQYEVYAKYTLSE